MRLISLQAGPYDLIWIGNATCEDLRQTGNREKVKIAQCPLGASAAIERDFVFHRPGPDEFQLLVGHELKGTMTDTKQRRNKATVEARDALRTVDLSYTRRE